jgi:hypothetical protein
MKCTCPNCGNTFKAEKPKAKPIESSTIERDGKIYYGIMVNYTDGPRMAYASFPVSQKSIDADKKRREKRIEQMGIRENNKRLEAMGMGITDAWVIDYLNKARQYRSY